MARDLKKLMGLDDNGLIFVYMFLYIRSILNL